MARSGSLAAWRLITEGEREIVLRRKAKKRYLSIMHAGRDLDALDSLSNRCVELFGHVVLERAGLRLIKSYDDVMILRCRLEQLHPILICIALSDPPMVSLDLSGSLRRLRKRGNRKGSEPLPAPIA